LGGKKALETWISLQLFGGLFCGINISLTLTPQAEIIGKRPGWSLAARSRATSDGATAPLPIAARTRTSYKNEITLTVALPYALVSFS
jgi:hypothetical protein